MNKSMSDGRVNRLNVLMKSIILGIFIGSVALTFTVSAETLNMKDNSCVYIPEINKDYCTASYEVCDPLSTVQKIDMKFAEVKDKTIEEKDLKSTLDNLIVDIDIKEGKTTCYNVKIDAWKSPLKTIDHVLCYDNNCHLEYGLWNATHSYRNAIYGNVSGLSAATSGMIPINITLNESLEFFWCNFTVNVTNDTIGYVYWNNYTDYICVDIDEENAVVTVIDEGNGSDYGNLDDNTIVWLDMGSNNCNGSTCRDKTIYGHTWNKFLTEQPFTTPAALGSGQDFDGNNDYLGLDNDDFWNSGFDDNTPTYIGGWFNIRSDAGNYIIGRDGHFIFIVDTNRKPTWYFWYDSAGGGSRVIPTGSNGDITYDTWHYIELYYNGIGADASIFIDLNNVTVTQASGSNPKVGTDTAYIMKYVSNYGNGTIDHVRMYNRTVSEDERKLWYYSQLILFSNGSVETNPSNETVPEEVVNITLDYTISFCYDDTYLYVKEKDINETGNAVFNSYLVYCENGCDNESLFNIGKPGCKESEMEEAVFLIVFIVVMFGLILWVAKK